MFFGFTVTQPVVSVSSMSSFTSTILYCILYVDPFVIVTLALFDFHIGLVNVIIPLVYSIVSSSIITSVPYFILSWTFLINVISYVFPFSSFAFGIVNEFIVVCDTGYTSSNK